MSQQDNKRADDFKASWFHTPSNSVVTGNIQEMFNQLRQEIAAQKLDYENKLLVARNEVIVLRHEVLTLRESMLRLNEDYLKLKPFLDERKRNLLLREHLPFPFTGDPVPVTVALKKEKK